MGTTTEQLINQAIQYPDYVIVAVAFLLFATYGFIRGTKPLSEFALALPLAAFVHALFPYNLGWGEPALYGALVVASTWVIARDTSGLDDNKDFFQVALAALGATIILSIIVNTTIDFTSLYIFGPRFTTFFANAQYTFMALVAGLAAISLSRKV